jgi:prepilin-type processing-associated H-X9-DG protein
VDPPTNSRRVREVFIEFAKCPSDEFDNVREDWDDNLQMNGQFAQTSYSGSLGSQATVSADSACNIWYDPPAGPKGIYYEDLPWNADHGNTWRKEDFSGIFNRMGYAGTNPPSFTSTTASNLGIKDVLDGTSNTIMVGEILGNCHDHRNGMWSYNGMGNAHASTSAPINVFTTCAISVQDATNKKYPFPNCAPKSNWNFSWGFKSRHPGGAQFVLCDGSARFVSQNINYATYQAVGGRRDGKPITGF